MTARTENIYLFWGCGIEKRGFLAYFGACQAKISVRGWCKLNISRVQGWCGSVKLICFFGAADWTQVCTVTRKGALRPCGDLIGKEDGKVQFCFSIYPSSALKNKFSLKPQIRLVRSFKHFPLFGGKFSFGDNQRGIRVRPGFSKPSQTYLPSSKSPLDSCYQSAHILLPMRPQLLQHTTYMFPPGNSKGTLMSNQECKFSDLQVYAPWPYSCFVWHSYETKTSDSGFDVLASSRLRNSPHIHKHLRRLNRSVDGTWVRCWHFFGRTHAKPK